jgi:[ribosomal protein S18]-alanine N-acetyltransferase
MRLQIRRMSPDDLDAIMEIEPVAFGSHHWSRQSFLNELSNPSGYYFVALNSDTHALCGYSGFWLIGEEAHITTLAVHPDMRRNHLGEILLINDIEAAQSVGASFLTLEVRVSNHVAQSLYFKYGFKNLGTRRKYYQDNDEDALVLWAENIRSEEYKKNVKSRLEYLAARMQFSDMGLISLALSEKSQNP